MASTWSSLAMAALTSLLACCGSGPPQRTYVLGSQTVQSAGIWSESGLPVIALDRVSVPDYLDSSDILRHTGPNELTASSTGRWGERLSQGLTNALKSSLSRQLPRTVISTTFGEKSDRRIQVEIERFDIEADGRCLISAKWQVIRGNGEYMATREHGTFIQTPQSADDQAITLAMSRTIDLLAEQIARATELE